MAHLPHPDSTPISIPCGIITVSDTRSPETDYSGSLIQQLLQDAGHSVATYLILKDEPDPIRMCLQQWSMDTHLDVVILNGGTGIAPRDNTYDVIEGLLEKTLPGFGELFRWLSYQEIGSRAIASRAIAGVYRSKLLFSLPGSTNAVKLAMEQLILPELNHLIKQLHSK